MNVLKNIPAISYSRTAFAIRICSPFTFFPTFFQLMDFQLRLRREDAWICLAVLICFSSYRCSTDYLATKHPTDVCTITGRVMSSFGSQPVSTPLQDGLRFSHHLSPYLLQHALRLACPRGRRHEVITFHVIDNEYLRSTLSAGGNIERKGVFTENWQLAEGI